MYESVYCTNLSTVTLLGAIDYGGETTSGAKRLVGAKRPGGKRLGGEKTRGGNGLGAKRPGFSQIYLYSTDKTFSPSA